jgi:hypothetical protein
MRSWRAHPAAVVWLRSPTRSKPHQTDPFVELTSLIAPNIGAYLCYLKKLTRFPDYSPDKVAGWTLLGNAQSDDLETIQNLISKVYAVASDDEELEPETTIV